jgi:hypothetical protein
MDAQIVNFTPNVQDRSVPLDELADRIRERLKDAKTALANALAAALDAGDDLIAAQLRVTDTPWQRWLKDNCFLSLSSAKLYMQLARHREEIEAAIEQAGELSLRAARRLIAKKPTDNAEVEVTEDDEPEQPRRSRKGDGQSPVDPAAMWELFTPASKREILAGEGRAGLAALMSPELMADLAAHSIRQDMIGASTKLKPAVTLTAILRTALDPAGGDSGTVFERFKAKLKSLGLDLHDISIAVKAKRGKR